MKRKNNIYIWELQNVVGVTSLIGERIGKDKKKFLLVSELKYRLEGGVLDDAVHWNSSSVF